MSEPLEDIIREIAAKHGIVVSRDDPILVLQTMNYRLLQDSARAQQVQLDHYKQELEELAHRWGADAKARAERILNASLQAGIDAMDVAMQDAAKRTAEAAANEIDVALDRLRCAMGDARRIAVLNVVAATLTVGAAAIVLWGLLG